MQVPPTATLRALALGSWGAEPIPPCSTALAAEVAGTIFGRLMLGHLSLDGMAFPEEIQTRIPRTEPRDFENEAAFAAEVEAAVCSMVQARARRHVDAPDPAGRDEALADIARSHLGFGSLARVNRDDRDFREVAVWKAKAALDAAFELGRAAVRAPDRAPDCSTPRAAQVAGVIANAVMAGEMSLGGSALPDGVASRLPCLDPETEAQGDHLGDLAEGFRVAGLMISARARASVRTPGHAALSGAEAALALIEDALLGPTEGEEVPDMFVVAEAARDTLRAGLAPLHAAERG